MKSLIWTFLVRNTIKRNEYKLQLILKMEHLIKRLIWKALAFFGKMEKNDTGKYESRTMSCPPEDEQITKLETHLLLMIKSITFSKVTNDFQIQLQKGIRQQQWQSICYSRSACMNQHEFTKVKLILHLNNIKTISQIN